MSEYNPSIRQRDHSGRPRTRPDTPAVVAKRLHDKKYRRLERLAALRAYSPDGIIRCACCGYDNFEKKLNGNRFLKLDTLPCANAHNSCPHLDTECSAGRAAFQCALMGVGVNIASGLTRMGVSIPIRKTIMETIRSDHGESQIETEETMPKMPPSD